MWSLLRLICALVALLTPAFAQNFPNGPVTLVVGWPPGGPVDVPARYIASELSASLGVPVIVENKPGATGLIGAERLLSAPRNGQVLLACTQYETMNPALYAHAKYKIADLAGITLIGRYYLYMSVLTTSSYTSLSDVFDSAKKNPGKLTYGSAGAGSSQEMLMRQLMEWTQTDMIGVPFRGTPPAITELLGGRLDTFMSASSVLLPLATDGKVRLLATTSPKRLAITPETPTFQELGYPLTVFGWLGVCAAKGTPPATIALLNEKITTITRTPKYRKMMESTAQIPESSTAEELDAIMSEMSSETDRLVRKYGIKASQ